MKSIFKVAAAALLAASLVPFDATGASLLGGIIRTGDDSGNADELVNLGGDGEMSVGLLGEDGVSVNLPDLDAGGGGDGLSLPVDLPDLDVGVPDVAEISTSPAPGGGTQIGVEIGGGGGGGIDLGLGSVGGVDVSLPDLGIGGGGGGNGGGGGGGFVMPSNISSRLKALLKILAERDYLRVANGRAVCLKSFGVAEVAGWVPQKDWGKLQSALSSYSQDIYALRQLLANCRSASQRQALNLTDLNRVIAIDINSSGQPVLFML